MSLTRHSEPWAPALEHIKLKKEWSWGSDNSPVSAELIWGVCVSTHDLSAKMFFPLCLLKEKQPTYQMLILVMQEMH